MPTSGSGSASGTITPGTSGPQASGAPLPISPAMAKGWLAGTGKYLDQVALDEGTTVDAVITRAIRSAQARIEDKSLTPYFVTRYCTFELARQLALTIGAAGAGGFDEYIQPLDYDVNQFRNVTGRTELPRMPVNSITTFRLTLASNGQIADIPAEWLNLQQEKGFVHLMPNAVTSLTATFFTLFAIHPMLLRPGMGSLTPGLIHLQYSAGLCERTAPDGTSIYDPTAYPLNTRWNQAQLQEYQTAIGQAAAALLLPKVKSAAQRAGITISVDGLSRSNSGTALDKMIADYKADSEAWAGRLCARSQGAGFVFV